MTAETLLRTPGFFRVAELVPVDQDVTAVRVGTRVERALEIMQDNGFDQLPVTTVEGRVVGAFTYRSFARSLRFVRNDVLRSPVDDLVEELQFVRHSQDLGGVLPHLEADHAVLVGDEDRLLAVVTTADVTRFLWERTRPFILLRDIELAIRDLMRSSCGETELAGVIAACLPDGREAPTGRLEDLTLAELLSVLLNGANYGSHFRHVFGTNRDLVRITLEPVRDIRNKVFHFRDQVSEQDIRQLTATTTWLRRRVLMRDGAR